MKTIKSKKKINFISIVILGLGAIFTSIAWGADSAVSIGDVAGNVFGVGLTVREIVRTVCIVTGCGLVLGSLVQYKKHRHNPIETTWGTVFFTFFTGVAIFCLSFIPIGA